MVWLLFNAIVENRVKEAMDLLKANENLLYAKHDDKQTIHYAAIFGQKEIVEYLLKKGVPVDLKDRHGWTPLLMAILNNHVDLVEFLIKQQADINVEAEGSNVVSVMSHYKDQKRVFSVLLKYEHLFNEKLLKEIKAKRLKMVF